ncbi:homing endonuclease [Vibrio phage VB_VaC_TDDLMA]
MYYTVYKITNKLNNKIYIGVHKTDNLDDGYMGSGKYLKYSQEKHGIENFDKEILHIFDNSEDMFKMESELVNEDFVQRKDTYNLRKGGCGGFDKTDSRRFEWSKCGNNSERNTRFSGHQHSEETKAYISRKIKIIANDPECAFGGNTFSGRKHTEETKQKMSDSKRGTCMGIHNSQYGRIWIYHPEIKECKKIKERDIHLFLELGWIKGRKMKFK